MNTTRIISYSRLPAMGFEHRYQKGQPFHCLIIRGVFDWDEAGNLTPAALQCPAKLADEYWGEPERSSVRYPADMVPKKPATDVLVIGALTAPEGKSATSWQAGLAVRDRQKILRVCGPRQWVNHLVGGWVLTEPEPTATVPLRYELAYGGHVPRKGAKEGDKPEVHPDNPLGCGFFGQPGPDYRQRYTAPQFEVPNSPLKEIDRPIAVAGFGPLNDFCEDRMQFAGTYQDEWDQDPEPPTPPDFKLDFWNSAPLDQRFTPYLKGGETIRLGGMTAEGELTLTLPRYRCRAVLQYDDGDRGSVIMDLDTVLIDLDHKQVHIRWFADVEFDERLEEIALLDTKDLVAPYREAEERQRAGQA